jgi:hypothetical protein
VIDIFNYSSLTGRCFLLKGFTQTREIGSTRGHIDIGDI